MKFLTILLIIAASFNVVTARRGGGMKTKASKGGMSKAGMKSSKTKGDKKKGKKGGPIAVSLWWVFFNKPEACIMNPGEAESCGPRDVFGDAYLDSVGKGEPDPSLVAPNMDAEIGILHATGGVTNKDGSIRLVASTYRTPEDLDLDSGIDPMGFGVGYRNMDAEVHIVVRSHGAYVGEYPQFTDFLEPYCDDPNLLWEGEKQAHNNICYDAQDALFAPGESGTPDTVFWFESREPVKHAKATLNRRGDGLQVIVETNLMM